jgi:hypothetical protein
VKRLFWLGVGIAVGALVVRQMSRAAQAYSPSGLADTARNSAAGLWESVQDFVADVREGMAEREEQIHAAFVQGVSLADLDADELDEDGDFGDYGYGGSYPPDVDKHGLDKQGGPDSQGPDNRWPDNRGPDSRGTDNRGSVNR